VGFVIKLFSHRRNESIFYLKGVICIYFIVLCSSIFLLRLFWVSCLHYFTLSNATLRCDVFHLTLSHFPKPPSPSLLVSQVPGLLPIVPLGTVKQKLGSIFRYYSAIRSTMRHHLMLCWIFIHSLHFLSVVSFGSRDWTCRNMKESYGKWQIRTEQKRVLEYLETGNICLCGRIKLCNNCTRSFLIRWQALGLHRIQYQVPVYRRDPQINTPS
jgi:hypothetical protein